MTTASGAGWGDGPPGGYGGLGAQLRDMILTAMGGEQDVRRERHNYDRQDRRRQGRRGPGGPGGECGPFGPGGKFGPGGPFGPGGGPFGPGSPGGPGGGPRGGPGGPRGGRGHRGRGRARRGDVRSAALFLLAEEERNGYQIIQELKERTHGIWRVSPGSIYPALSQLEDEGLIEPVDDGRRKTFRLTDAGRADVEANADKPRPWAFAEQEAQEDDAGGAGVWFALGQVGMATHAVTQGGDETMLRDATKLLNETRRKLYRMLAEADLDEAEDGLDEDELDEDPDLDEADESELGRS